jgi:hypothetical protein
MRDVGRSASTDVLSGTSALVGAPDEVFGTHTLSFLYIAFVRLLQLLRLSRSGQEDLRPG